MPNKRATKKKFAKVFKHKFGYGPFNKKAEIRNLKFVKDKTTIPITNIMSYTA